MSPNWWEQYSQILKGVRILIVDDEESAREAFREILSSLGLEIRTANSVSCALKVLNEFNPAVLVSDIAMPGEDGYDLIRKVRTSLTSNRTLPAIALTAFASREDAIKALNSGFQAHLVKPVDIVKLIHTITDLTGLSQNIKTR
jgi:CheY-like chemotaxis protein